jgi:hypothetical protein
MTPHRREPRGAALGITVYQARRKWTYARAWFPSEMRRE